VESTLGWGRTGGFQANSRGTTLPNSTRHRAHLDCWPPSCGQGWVPVDRAGQSAIARAPNGRPVSPGAAPAAAKPWRKSSRSGWDQQSSLHLQASSGAARGLAHSEPLGICPVVAALKAKTAALRLEWPPLA